jgi:EAL domain-containing protein (putative c-di-GMP-specific phosphodiesterase class I)
MEQLRALDCDVIQGHHIGKPLPLEEIEKRLPPLSNGGKIRHIKDYR